jgi:proline iminopeptidase
MPIVHLNQTDLFYVEVGNGFPCLVMHGGLGLDHTHMHPALDSLGDVFRLIYYDHRGNGRSGRPPLETLTFDQFCADADALRQHLGFEKVAVIGSSMGGIIVLQYALRYPERLSYLILMDTAAVFDYGDEVAANIERKGPSEEIRAAQAAPPPTNDEATRDSILTLAPLYFHVSSAELIDRVWGKTIYSHSAYSRNGALLKEHNVRPRLAEIRIPTLVITGDDDFITPPSAHEVIHQGIPGSELMILENSGHFPHIETPDAFFTSVRGWLSRVM